MTTTGSTAQLNAGAPEDTFQQAIQAEIIKQLIERGIASDCVFAKIRRIPVHEPYVNYLIVETSGRIHNLDTKDEVLQTYVDEHMRCGASLIDVAEIRMKLSGRV